MHTKFWSEDLKGRDHFGDSLEEDVKTNHFNVSKEQGPFIQTLIQMRTWILFIVTDRYL
jgi:hypothetical protein